MIKIDDEFYIDADSKCFMLVTKGKIEDEKSENYGKEKFNIEGSYVSIELALKGYLKHKTRQYVSKDTENTIKDLQKFIKDLDKKIREEIKI